MNDAITIRFRLNGGEAEVRVPPAMSLQRVLRDVLGLTGTKDGCREGECGACTVLLDRVPVDSCIVPICHVSDREVLTIEAFSGAPAEPHPLVAAFVSHGAVQCGFCTPGMIMAAAGVLLQTPDPTRAQIETGLAGNLCRCTGYEKIIESVQVAAETLNSRPCSGGHCNVIPPLVPRQYSGYTDETDGVAIRRIQSIDELDTLNTESGPIRFLSGGTDLMVQKTNRKLTGLTWVDLSGIRSLRGISMESGLLRVGPLETWFNIAQNLMVNRYARTLAEAAMHVGSDHIMRRATIGGNLGNAAACADGFPPLTALHAEVRTRLNGHSRCIPVETLAVANGRSILESGELITDILIPISETAKSGFHKSMPRHAQCIAKVSIAINLPLQDGRFVNTGFAMGAVGPTVIRVKEAEMLLNGRTPDEIDIHEIACTAVKAAKPINDFRSDIDYRLRIVELETQKMIQKLLD